MASARNKLLDFVKGILIFLVVVGHTLQFVAFRGSDKLWHDPLFTFIYVFHMPLFMAIAGYLSGRSIDQSGFFEILKSKTTAYLLPIVSWAILFQTMLFAIMPCSFDELAHKIIGDATGSLWFLWSLLFSIVATSIIRNLKCKFIILYPLSTIAILFLLQGNLPLVSWTYPFFQIGYLVHRNLRTTQPVPRWAIYMAGLVTIPVLVYWSDNTYAYRSRMFISLVNMQNILLCLAGGISLGVFVFLSLQRFHNLNFIGINRFFQKLGTCSLHIYIIQTYFWILYTQINININFDYSKWQTWTISISSGLVMTYIFSILGHIFARIPGANLLMFGRPRRIEQKPIKLQA